MPVIHLRCEQELVDRLDALAADMDLRTAEGAPNRSAVIRYICQRATGEKATRAALIEEVIRVHATLSHAVRDVTRDFLEALEARLVEPYALESEPAGVAGVAPLPARSRERARGR